MSLKKIPQSGEKVWEDDIVFPDTIPFLLVHLSCLLIFFTGVSLRDLLLCITLFYTRMWAITAGYHRYFSHRSFKTSRTFQFILAFLCQTSAQQGILWWSAKHREHHRFSDTPNDIHSPRQFGFFFSHVGWIFSRRKGVADYSYVKDLLVYPELLWLDRHKYFPAIVLGFFTWLFFGISGLVVGFFLSTVLLYHATFCINSLAHLSGKQRYFTGDDSRNSLFLALLTLGEGWHNNHHFYPTSTRQGFFFWEIDPTYYVLKLLSWIGIVWDLRSPPPHVLKEERKIPREVLGRLAGRFLSQMKETLHPVYLTLEKEVVSLKGKTKEIRNKKVLTYLKEHLSRPEIKEKWKLPTVEEVYQFLKNLYPRRKNLEDLASEIWIYLISLLPEELFSSLLIPSFSQEEGRNPHKFFHE